MSQGSAVCAYTWVFVPATIPASPKTVSVLPNTTPWYSLLLKQSLVTQLIKRLITLFTTAMKPYLEPAESLSCHYNIFF
jgi:hypothetical protein